MGIFLFMVVSCFMRESTIFSIFIRTTSNMHWSMCEKVLRSNILFFDSNPVGRILTRFSKDIAVLDIIAPSISILMTYGIFRAIAVTISLCVVNYWLLIPTAISFAYLIYLWKNAQLAMIESQKLDAIVRGPIHSLFSNVINGLISIRAYEQVFHF